MEDPGKARHEVRQAQYQPESAEGEIILIDCRKVGFETRKQWYNNYYLRSRYFINLRNLYWKKWKQIVGSRCITCSKNSIELQLHHNNYNCLWKEILFKDAVQDKKKNTINIPVELVSKDKKVNMLYKLRKVEKRWKIYDVEIQGVSIVLTYRAQFNDILSKGTVKDLLLQLEKPPES